MSFLYGAAFLVLLAVLIFLSVVRNRAGADLHAKLHPPRKEQEEFLKACELYLEYKNDLETHPEPEADAKYDAAVWIRKEGYLPAALEQLPVQSTDRRFKKKLDHKKIMREDGEPAYMTYDAIRNIRQEAFRSAQKQDGLLTGYAQDPRFWREDGTFDTEAWKTYCADMNAAFSQLAERAAR